MYQKASCKCKIVVLAIKPIACLTFSLPLPSPSSDLKVPTDFVGKPVKASSQNVGYVLRLKTLV